MGAPEGCQRSPLGQTSHAGISSGRTAGWELIRAADRTRCRVGWLKSLSLNQLPQQNSQNAYKQIHENHLLTVGRL